MAKFPITDKADPTFSITHSDINECLSDNGGCHHNCHNSVGSYSCSCNNGYQLNSDGHTCEGRLCSLHIETILSDISSDDLKPYYTILNIAIMKWLVSCLSMQYYYSSTTATIKLASFWHWQQDSYTQLAGISGNFPELTYGSVLLPSDGYTGTVC